MRIPVQGIQVAQRGYRVPDSNMRSEDRCTDINDGHRCQLLAHDDDQHCAMVHFDIGAARGNRRKAVVEYRRWGAPWTKPTPGQATLKWAPTFPAVESSTPVS